MLEKVDRILVRVPVVAAAATYYRDTLGMELVREDGKLALFRLKGCETELVVHADRELPDQAFYYRVEDVRAVYGRREELRLIFTAPPRRVARGYTATCRDPMGQVLLLIDRTVVEETGEAAGVIEDAAGRVGLFGGAGQGVELRYAAKEADLAAVYGRIGRTADDLPYTPHFETLYTAYSELFGEQRPGRREVWRHLLTMRKKAALPKLGKAKSIPPEISAEDRQRLIGLVGEHLGKRDRLPYTPEFDGIVNEFNRTHVRKISPHLVWRLVATLAK